MVISGILRRCPLADNVQITQGSGTFVAAEACSGTANALVQRIKLVLGATDTDGGNVSSANPMPVLSGTAGNFLVTAAGTVTALSGTAGNFLCTVTQGSSVTVISGTAGNLLAQVSGTITATGTVTVLSGTAANLLSQVSGSVTAVSGTAANFLATVTQGSSVTVISPTAANMLTLTTITAGTNNIGQVISGQQMSIYNGTAALTVSYAAINFTTSAGNTIVSAVGSKNIYILSGVLVCQNATNLQWFSGTTAGTAISGVMCMTANEGHHLPYVPIGNFATLATNAAITLNSSVATTVGGWVTYVAF